MSLKNYIVFFLLIPHLHLTYKQYSKEKCSLSLLSRNFFEKLTFWFPPLKSLTFPAGGGEGRSAFLWFFFLLSPLDYVLKSEPIWWRSLLLMCCMLWLVVSRRRWLLCGSDTMRMVPGARFLRGLRFLPSVVSFLLVIGGSRVVCSSALLLIEDGGGDAWGGVCLTHRPCLVRPCFGDDGVLEWRASGGRLRLNF